MSPLLATLCFSVLLSNIVLPSYGLRKDYTFIGTTKSFYKYIKKKADWRDSISKCKDEGAVLFYPEDKTELELVLREFKFGENNEEYLRIGISDLRRSGVYETVDGRPISQVYNKTWPEQLTTFRKGYDCVGIKADDHRLHLQLTCMWRLPYICKYKVAMEDLATTAMIEEVKTIIANASDKLATSLDRQAEAMERLAAADENQSAALGRLTESMQGQAGNQTATLEQLMEDMQAAAIENQSTVSKQLTESMQRQAANQTTTLEKLAEGMQRQAAASKNQNAAIKQLTESMQQQVANQTLTLKWLTESMQQQAANQTSTLEKLTESMQRQAAASENQSAALEQLTESMQQQAAKKTSTLEKLTEGMQQQAANETSALMRVALALEKLAEDNISNR